MKLIYLLVLGGLLVLTFFLIFFQKQTQSDYEKKIERLRLDKNNFFRNSDLSPIKDKAQFKSLNYFKINKNFKVKAKVKRLNDSDFFYFTSSKGNPIPYKKYGLAKFFMFGKPYYLTVFQHPENQTFFVPFLDETNKKETYRGGRYLEIQKPDSPVEMVLDFNLAFHPYCLYNENYACPIPPKSNYLPTKILAGERL